MLRLFALSLVAHAALVGAGGVDAIDLALQDADDCDDSFEEEAFSALQVRALQKTEGALSAQAAQSPFAVTAETPSEIVVVAANSFNERERYAGAVFFGHMNPDADSIGSAYAAAEFYGGGGIPACPMPRQKCPNDESKFLMDRFEVDVSEVPVLSEVPDLSTKRIVLVDFNDPSKGPNPFFPDGAVPPLVKNGRWQSPPVVGALDHHALQMTGLKVASTPSLFYGYLGNMSVETHAWGCCCSVIAMKYKLEGRSPSTKAAGLMLGGILSDTLGLTGPTTTDYDKEAVAFLSEHAGVTDTQALYLKMAEAKSAKVLSDPLEKTFDADLKVYDVVPGKARLVIGSVEVANREIYQELLDKPSEELAAAIANVSALHADAANPEAGLYVYIFVVNTWDKESTLVTLSEGPNACLATRAMSRSADGASPLPEGKECRPAAAEAEQVGEKVSSVGGGSCVSRKAQVQPSLEAAVEAYTSGTLACSER